MTAFLTVVGVSSAADRETVTDLFDASSYTRLPVYQGTIAHIVGVIHLKALYWPESAGLSVRQLMKPVLNAASTSLLEPSC